MRLNKIAGESESVSIGAKVILATLILHLQRADCSVWVGGFGSWYNLNVSTDEYELNLYVDSKGISDIIYDERFEYRIHRRLKRYGVTVPKNWLSEIPH